MSTLRVVLAASFLTCFATSTIAQSDGPSNLTVTAASRTAVKISWQAPANPPAGFQGYYVYRRAVSDGPYLAPFNTLVTATTFTDTSFDPTVAYAYRVYSVVNNNSQTATSEVMAGPPPAGFSLAAKTPKALQVAGTGECYGQLVSMALDVNGDPAIAFKDECNATSDNRYQTLVYFTGWDRAKYAWKAPVKIDTVHAQHPSAPEIALAFDASNNRFGVAYLSDIDMIARVSMSNDNGATWSTPQAAPWVTGSAVGLGGVAFKMSGGQAYLAYSQDPGGVWYLSGSQTDALSAWSRKVVPGLLDDWFSIFDIAVDSQGAPAVAFVHKDVNQGTDVVAFWRPSGATVTQVTTSNAYANMGGNPDIKLVFDGTNPRILTSLKRNSANDTDLWFVASANGGATWSTPLAMTGDGEVGLGALVTMAVGPNGQIAASASNGGGFIGSTMTCGLPKVFRSSDMTKWTTCDPGTSPAPAPANFYPSAQFGSNGKLMLAFQIPNTSSNVDLLDSGVWLWREAPQPSGMTYPIINEAGIINNASHVYGNGLAPGTIVEIYGLRLGQLASAGNLPLGSLLGPSSALTTAVSVNGVPAPSFFTSVGQLNVQIPFEAPPGKDVPVTVTVNDSLSTALMIHIVAFSPGIYAAVNASNHSSHKPGDFVTVYLAGMGAVNDPPPNGWVSTAVPLSKVLSTVTATIGGRAAEVSFAGLTPFSVALYQVNLQIPPDLAPGTYTLVVLENGTPSNSFTITVTAP